MYIANWLKIMIVLIIIVTIIIMIIGENIFLDNNII